VSITGVLINEWARISTDYSSRQKSKPRERERISGEYKCVREGVCTAFYSAERLTSSARSTTTTSTMNMTMMDMLIGEQ
jgi:hypothetical protein